MIAKKPTKKPWAARIAGNKHTPYFDTAYGQTMASAIAAVKRKNSPDWQDCVIWADYVGEVTTND